MSNTQAFLLVFAHLSQWTGAVIECYDVGFPNILTSDLDLETEECFGWTVNWLFYGVLKSE